MQLFLGTTIFEDHLSMAASTDHYLYCAWETKNLLPPVLVDFFKLTFVLLTLVYWNFLNFSLELSEGCLKILMKTWTCKGGVMMPLPLIFGEGNDEIWIHFKQLSCICEKLHMQNNKTTKI